MSETNSVDKYEKMNVREQIEKEKEKLNNIIAFRKKRVDSAHESLVETYRKMLAEQEAQNKKESFLERMWNYVSNSFKKFTKYK
jgi:hypothetical protein